MTKSVRLRAIVKVTRQQGARIKYDITNRRPTLSPPCPIRRLDVWGTTGELTTTPTTRATTLAAKTLEISTPTGWTRALSDNSIQQIQSSLRRQFDVSRDRGTAGKNIHLSGVLSPTAHTIPRRDSERCTIKSAKPASPNRDPPSNSFTNARLEVKHHGKALTTNFSKRRMVFYLQ